MARKVYEMAFELGAKMQSSFAGAFETANSKIAKLAFASKELKKEMDDLDRVNKKGQISVSGYMDAYAKLSTKMAATERQHKSLSRAMQMQQSMDNARSKSREAMMGAMETGMVLYAPTSAAVEFETAMSGVAKQVEGARDESGKLTDVYYAMQTQVRATALEMGVLPSRMAETYAMTAKLGVKGADNISMVAKAATMLGPAFEMSQTQVVEQLAKIGNGLGISLETREGIDSLLALADTINYLDDQSVAAGQDIMDVMKRTAGMIREGSMAPTLSPKTLAALATGMLEMGETSETAATAMNAMFVKFAAAPTESKSFQLALQRMGWSAEQLQSGIINDAEGTIFRFFDDLSKLDAASRNNAMAEIFGKEHIDNLSKLAGGTENFVQRIRDANSEAAKGSVAKEWANRLATTAAKLEKFQAAAMNLGITIGTYLLPPLSALAEWGANEMAWMTKFAEEHSQLAGILVTGAAGVLGFATAMAGLFYVGSAIISPFVTMYSWFVRYEVATKLSAAAQWLWNASLAAGRYLVSGTVITSYVAALMSGTAVLKVIAGAQWLWNAALTANPVGVAITAIWALIAAGIWLYQNWDMVQTKLVALWADFSAAYPAIAATVETYVGYVVAFWQALPGYIDSAIAGLPDIIKSPFAAAFAWLSNKFTWLENKWAAMKSMLSSGASGGGGGSGPDIAENYSGGIYSKGAFLTTFAERSAEAAIPLDGSRRAVGLWQQAGQMLGVNPSGGGGNIQVTYAPVVHGGGDPAVVQQVLRQEADSFMDQFAAVMRQERRLSYE